MARTMLIPFDMLCSVNVCFAQARPLLALLSCLVLGAAGCVTSANGSDPPQTAGTGGSGGLQASGGAAGTVGTAGGTGGASGQVGGSAGAGQAGAAPAECTTALDCHDGQACTRDRCESGACVHDDAGCSVDLAAEQLETSVVFETEEYQLSTDNSYSPVMSDGASTYFVWVDAEFRPRVTRIEGGQAQTVRLDANDAYRARDDGHHKFSLGIDRQGYVHVTGDMHHHPASNTDHLPEAYASSAVMYWVSKEPRSIGGFDFVGDDPGRALPGYGFSYGSFNVAPDGTLYYLSRIRVHELGHHEGEMGLGLFRYDTASRAWIALGGLPPSERPAAYPCVVWEDNGHDQSFYQGFRASMRFDAYGTLHLSAVLNADSSVDAPTHAVYVASDDGGESFRRADGTPIETLPARVEPGASQADVPEGPNADYDLFGGVFFDGNGVPAISFTRKISGDHHSSFRYWDPGSSTWSDRMESPAGGYIRHKHQVDPLGILTFVDNGGKMVRTRSFNGEGVTHWVKVDGESVNINSIDEYSLQRDHVWLGVYENHDRTRMGVVRLNVVGG
jgi:BNR repeat-containing family member